MLDKLNYFLGRLGFYETTNCAYLDCLRRIGDQKAQFARLETPSYLRRRARIRRVATSR